LKISGRPWLFATAAPSALSVNVPFDHPGDGRKIEPSVVVKWSGCCRPQWTAIGFDHFRSVINSTGDDDEFFVFGQILW